MDLHAADVDDVGVTAPEEDTVIDDLDQVSGGAPRFRTALVPGGLVVTGGSVRVGVAEHAGRGAHPKLATEDADVGSGIVLAVQRGHGESGPAIAHRGDGAEFGRGVD